MNIFKIDIRMAEDNFGYDVIEIPKQYQFITIINNTDNSICLYPSYVTEPIPNLCMFRVPEYTTMTFPRVLNQTDYTILWANDHGTPGLKQAYILLSDVNLQLNFSYSVNNILNQGIDVNIVNPLPQGTNLIGQVDVSDRTARQLGIVSLTGSIPTGSNVIGSVDVTDRTARQLGQVNAYITGNANQNTWTLTGSADNAAITLTKAGVTGQSHYITGIMAGYSQSKTGLLQLKDGANVIFEHYIVNADVITLNNPIKLTAGNDLTATLEASGTAGMIGKLNVIGFTM